MGTRRNTGLLVRQAGPEATHGAITSQASAKRLPEHTGLTIWK